MVIVAVQIMPGTICLPQFVCLLLPQKLELFKPCSIRFALLVVILSLITSFTSLEI